MGYIPKSLVNTGLYTNGGEFIDPSTGKSYKGYFHETFNGDVGSGKTPNSPNSIKLVKNYNVIDQNNNILPTKENIKYSILQPTIKNYIHHQVILYLIFQLLQVKIIKEVK